MNVEKIIRVLRPAGSPADFIGGLLILEYTTEGRSRAAEKTNTSLIWADFWLWDDICKKSIAYSNMSRRRR